VVCFLWFDPNSPRADVYTYDESHVRRLKRQVEAHLAATHEFICVTDRNIEGVKTIPLSFDTFVSGTRLAKLMMFAPEGPLVGKRLLYLDLDAIVTGDLLPLVNRSDDLVLWGNPNFGIPGRARYNTSIILHTCGTRSEFWTEFDRGTTLPMVQQDTGWGGTDQAWVSYRASPNEAHWTDADGVYGAGRLLRPDGALDGVGTELPPGARIVFTPGRRTPWTPGFAEDHPWASHFEVAA
jgi:hypothetical protein